MLSLLLGSYEGNDRAVQARLTPFAVVIRLLYALRHEENNLLFVLLIAKPEVEHAVRYCTF